MKCNDIVSGVPRSHSEAETNCKTLHILAIKKEADPSDRPKLSSPYICPVCSIDLAGDGKLGYGFTSADELEEVDIGPGDKPRPTFISKRPRTSGVGTQGRCRGFDFPVYFLESNDWRADIFNYLRDSARGAPKRIRYRPIGS